MVVHMNYENPGCYKTFAVLRIASNSTAFSALIKNQIPSGNVQINDNTVEEKKNVISPLRFIEISTEGKLKSTDLQKHIKRILQIVADNKELERDLANGKLSAELICYWISKNGLGGGPILDPKILDDIKVVQTISFRFSTIGRN